MQQMLTTMSTMSTLSTMSKIWGIVFNPINTHFWSQNDSFSRHFVTLEGPKWLAMGSKRACFVSFGTSSGLGSFLEKHNFYPFPTHFLSQNNPTSSASLCIPALVVTWQRG